MQNQILSYIKNDSAFTIIKDDICKDNLISSCQLLGKQTKETVLNPMVLYFARYGYLSGTDITPGCNLVILNSEGKRLNSGFLSKAGFVASCSNIESLIRVYQKCMDFIILSGEMDKMMINLNRMIAQDYSTKALLNYIAEFYHNPISIIDNGYMLVAHSDTVVPKGDILGKEYNRGYLDNDAVATLAKINFLNPASREPRYSFYDFPQSSDGRSTGYTRNNYAIIFENSIAVAAISIFDNGELSDEKLQYLVPISYALSNQLRKSNFYLLNKGTYYQHLLSMIVGDLPFDEAIMENRLAANGYQLKPYIYFISAVMISDQQTEFKSTNALGSFLKNIIKDAIYLVLEKRVVLMISRDELISDAELKDWYKSLKNNNIYIGISNYFKNLGEAKSHLLQAMDALTIGVSVDREQLIYPYYEFQIENIVRCFLENNQRERMVYQPVIDLVSYDAENNSELLATLMEYLKDPKDPKAVCEKLFIHKNTLYYRLNKIRDFLGNDFDSIDSITKINLTVKLLEYEKRQGKPTQY